MVNFLEDQLRENIHRCFRCGFCKFTSDYSGYNCPIYDKFRTDCFSPGGILWLMNAVFKGEIEITPELQNIIFSCTMCGNCSDKCPYEFHKDITNMIIASRGYLIEKQLIPQNVRNFLKNMIENGQHWKKKEEYTAIPYKKYNYKGGWLLFLGDMCNYSEYSRQSIVKLMKLLDISGFQYGIIQDEPFPDGNDILMMGETEMYSYYEEENKALFNKLEITKIFTYSPHSYNAFKNLYQMNIPDYEVVHYTDILSMLLDKGYLHLKNTNTSLKISYHDPCFLGRWNNQYDSARNILKALPGCEFIELDYTRKDALCCGGGGGNIYTDMIGSGVNSPSRKRIREACNKRIDVLAVSCPVCAAMLQDAVIDEMVQEQLKVKDISDILIEYVEY